MVAPPEESGSRSCPQNAGRLPWIGNPVRSRNSTRCCKSYYKVCCISPLDATSEKAQQRPGQVRRPAIFQRRQ